MQFNTNPVASKRAIANFIREAFVEKSGDPFLCAREIAFPHPASLFPGEAAAQQHVQPAPIKLREPDMT
jgi:hypothetical protein